MALLQDAGAAVPGGREGIELIDVVFAFSNIKLVRELVQDNVRQLEGMRHISKGQTEGLMEKILERQRALHNTLSEVEKLLEGIIDANIAPRTGPGGMRNIRLSADQSKAMIGAIVFAMNHMAKFVPGARLGGLPESLI